MDVKYDDSQLQKLFMELEPKRRLQAIKGGIRREARQVRKQAVTNLKATGVHVNKQMEKNVRAEVFRKRPGFRVTVATKQKKSAKNKRLGYSTGGKPYELVDIWLENGTPERKTKPKGIKRRTWVKRKAHATGRIKHHGYMLKTLREVRGQVTDDLHKEVINNVLKTAKKYGCN